MPSEWNDASSPPQLQKTPDCRQRCRQVFGSSLKYSRFRFEQAKPASFPKKRCGFMAESQGFEPWVRDYRTHDFQSCAFDHSANSPNRPICSHRGRDILYRTCRVSSRFLSKNKWILSLVTHRLSKIDAEGNRLPRLYFTSEILRELPYTVQFPRRHHQNPARRY